VKPYRVDSYVVDTLMPDLVLHDRQPSAFLVYLYLWCRSGGRAAGIRASHRAIVDATGLSKSAVQAALRTLTRRRLVKSARRSATDVPEYSVLRPWRR